MGKKGQRARARRDIDIDIAANGIVEAGGSCGAPVDASVYKVCPRPAGELTDHVGYGLCKRHGGNAPYERARGAWMMAHAFAKELNVSPWEALLMVVRMTAGEVAWLNEKVAAAPDDAALLRSASEAGYAEWVEMRRDALTRLARVSKAAVDAGVAERVVAQIEGDGQAIARVLNSALACLDLNSTQLLLARQVMRNELLALDSAARVREGEVRE